MPEIIADRPRANNHDRSLGSIVAEIKMELKEFLNTRFQMIKAELQETISAVKTALPLSLLALGLFSTAFLLLTLAAVALVVSAFAGSPYAWFFAFVIIGVLWLCFGGIATFFAYNALRSKGRFPKRTAEVLKADTLWLQTEARSHS